MNINTQNEKIKAISETASVFGVDVGSKLYYARTFDFRDIEYSKREFESVNTEV